MKRTLLTRGRAVALALVMVTGVAGCSVNSPLQTTETMQVSDGAPLDLDRAKLRNLLIVSDVKGGHGTLIGTIDNVTSEEITVTISAGDSKVTQKVPPWELVRLSEKDLTTIEGLEAGAGAMVKIQVSTGPDDGSPVDVPVLPAFAYYEEYAPKEYTPAPTPTQPEETGEHQEAGEHEEL